MRGLLLRDGRRYGGAPVDLLLRDGRIAAAGRGVEPDGAEVVDLGGRFVGPGLWDHHVHLRQTVMARRRLDIAGVTSAAETLALVADALARRTSAEMLVGYGFRDGTWPDEPSLAALDAVAGDTPVILVSGDLHCAWFSSKAAADAGVLPDALGLVREGPWIEALAATAEAAELTPAMYAEVADAAAARGIVGVIELENADNHAEWPRRVAAGVRSLRIEASVWPDRLEEAIAAGRRSGDVLDELGLVTVGPLKVVVDGSLNTRTALCLEPYPDGHSHGVVTVPVTELRRLLTLARDHGVDAAVHAIGDRANREVLDVFEELGMPGAIEHAQLVAADDFARFGRLGIVAGVQPEHAMDDRDVADRHWAGRTGRAFALASLVAGGARLRLGSDTPVATFDPWVTIAAATTRSRGGRPSWHAEQRIPAGLALAASARHGLDPGAPADVVVTDLDPLIATEEELRAMPVAGTLLGGRWTWRDPALS